ncbi:hypothetical protein AGMMS49940_09140 [Spirochaetia bacterium]|nr:hypothetical protein AGMMS49940_09140 [Spirochaetia bacterium]
MKKSMAAVLLFLVLFPVFSQKVEEPSTDTDAKRLDTIRYGTETEIAALIQTLKTENTPGMDDELITVAKNTRNRSILSGVFSFFADREKTGLEERALKAIEERDDEANETVLAALAYLGKIKAVQAVLSIRSLLDAEESRFSGACIKALGLIGGSMPDAAETVEYLIDYYQNRTPGDENRREIIIALGEMKAAAGAPFLQEIVENNDERPVLRMSALDALAKIGDPGGLPAVLQAVESADPNIRSSAVAALGPFQGDEVNKTILEAFRDGYYKTRMAAAQAARDRRLAEAVPYLRFRAERDDVPAVKDEAIKALGAIGNSDSLAILSSLFAERKNTDRVRLLSAEMLLQDNADAYAAKVIEELDEAKQKNLTSLYNGFLRILSTAKAPALEDLARRFFVSGAVVEKSYALDMVRNNNFRSLADQVRELTNEKYGSLSRKAKVVVEQMGL